jgi:hypothetical protein
MWNNIKNFIATTNWQGLLFAVVVQWAFTFLVWSQLFGSLIGWSVPGIIRMVVNLGVFMVAYVWFARRFPLRRYR